MFENLFAKYLLKYFSWILLYVRQLNINNSSLVDMYLRSELQSVNLSLSGHSEKLSKRPDNELGIS